MLYRLDKGYPEKPVLITNVAGKIEYPGEDFDFQIGDDTEVYHSCSITWRSQFFLFGGEKEKTQISTITGCKLDRIGTLSFELDFGGCANINDETIYLCFSITEGDSRKCRIGQSPVGDFSGIDDSSYQHGGMKLGVSEGKKC